MLLERALYHLLIVPIAGLAAWGVFAWPWWQALALDAALSVGYEAIRLKAWAAVSVGVKDVLPILIYFRLSLPGPTTLALVLSGTVLAGVAVGVATYQWRRRTRPAVHGGRDWRRPMLAAGCMAVGIMVESFAAGAILLAPPVGLFHLALIAFGAPWWLAAYRLQTPPRRGGPRARRLDAVLNRARGLTGRIALIGQAAAS